MRVLRESRLNITSWPRWKRWNERSKQTSTIKNCKRKNSLKIQNTHATLENHGWRKDQISFRITTRLRRSRRFKKFSNRLFSSVDMIATHVVKLFKILQVGISPMHKPRIEISMQNITKMRKFSKNYSIPMVLHLNTRLAYSKYEHKQECRDKKINGGRLFDSFFDLRKR